MSTSSSFALHTLAAGRTRRRGGHRSSAVTVTRVDRAVWRCALDLAGGDSRRLRVASAAEVLVLNSPPRRHA